MKDINVEELFVLIKAILFKCFQCFSESYLIILSAKGNPTALSRLSLKKKRKGPTILLLTLNCK